MPSVTTILSVLNKPELLRWANSLGFRRQSYDKTLDRAAYIGTLTHAAIEADIEKLLFIYPLDDTIHGVGRRFAQWKYWATHAPFTPVRSEISLSCDRFGGTIDCMGYYEGIPTLFDWKTSKAFYPEMFLQLSAYAHLWNLHYEEKVTQAMVVLVHEEQTKRKKITKETMDALYEIFCSIVEVFYQRQRLNDLL